MAKKSVVTGKIEVKYINDAHIKIKTIVSEFHDLKKTVHDTTNTLKENWVGDGRDEFESQYKYLISKMDDFSDALDDIYDALVEAEGNYEITDDSIRQEYAMSMQN